MFGWIRNKVKNAVLSGVVDAMDYLDGEAKGIRQDVAGTLESRYKLLPAPIVVNGSQDDSDMETDPNPVPTVSKRGKRS